MLVAQFWQHAGVERPLSVSTVHQVPDAVGRWLVDHGYAVVSQPGPLEMKPLNPTETKKRGARVR